MNRRSPQELKKLTIPRLQVLLKTTRARYMDMVICPCCGESYQSIYDKDHPRVKAMLPYKAYYQDVKAELKRRQKP